MQIDTGRLEELHIVRKVREIARRWWGVELSFTDARGFVLDHGKGIIIPPGNQLCTACLGDGEGLRRCNRSIERAVAGRLGVSRTTLIKKIREYGLGDARSPPPSPEELP